MKNRYTKCLFLLAPLCLAITGCDWKPTGGGDPSNERHSERAPEGESCEANKIPVVTTNFISRSLMRQPLEPEATKRLADGPQEITTTFQATGNGAWKKFGGKASGKYFFTSYVKAVSIIADKEEMARGNVEVTEIRKFIEVRDQLTVSEIDIGFSLRETLPIDTVTQVVTGIGVLLDMVRPGVGTMVEAANEGIYQTIKAVDGESLRGLCGKFGLEIPEDVEKWAKELSNEYVNGKLSDIRNKVHSIEGKSYKVVYLQDKEGAPLRVDFTNVDGSEIAEDEWDILKLANVFIDAEVIPDKRVQPGDRWEVDVNTIAGLVDPVAQGGSCEGKLSIERKDDLPGGDWKLHFLPARITTKSDGGATAGVFRIADGNAVGDGERGCVKSMQLVGTGRLGKKKSERWAIFNFMTRIDGECEFRAIMTTNPAK